MSNNTDSDFNWKDAAKIVCFLGGAALIAGAGIIMAPALAPVAGFLSGTKTVTAWGYGAAALGAGFGGYALYRSLRSHLPSLSL